MAMTVDKDTQELIVSTLIKNSHLYSICKDQMSDGHFSDPSCKIIYKALSVYYNKYGTIPSINELLVTIDSCYYTTVGVNLSEVKDTCCRLYEFEEPDEEFIKDKIIDFIRKVNSAAALKEFIEQVKINPNLESDNVLNNLVNALEVSLTTNRVFSMSDATQVKEARSAAVGDGQSKIVQSFIDSINTNLMFGGWQPGTVNMICSPPGCFTGDTKIMTLDGESHSLEEMYEQQFKPEIYGSDKNANIKVGKSAGIYLSEYTNNLIEVEIDNKFKIKCTPDHPFMLRDGSYKEAQDLQEFDELMPIKREYRYAGKAGGELCTKAEGYECVVNGNDSSEYTHRLSAGNIEHLEEQTQVHHKDHNRLNNYSDNLEWMTKHDHASYHYWVNYSTNESFRQGTINGRIKPGEHLSPSTEITSEEARERNLRNWQNEKYREKMRPVSIQNGKASEMVNVLNYSKEFQYKTQRGKVLSFINRLLIEFPNIDINESNYEDIAAQSKAKRKVWLKGIWKYFDCSFAEVLEQAKAYNHKVTKITKIHLDEKVPVYGVVDAKPFGNYAIALDNENGVFVHNTGKTMYLINEGVNAAKQGFDVLHVFIGDMVEYDGFIRYLSCISGTPQNTLVMTPVDKQMRLVEVCNQQYDNIFDHISLLAYPSLSLTVDTLIEDIIKFEKQLNKDYGMIIIDYPDNLILEGNSLYTDGGTLYSSLEKLARLTKAVLLVASQPQKAYWDHEIIPLEAASESSKKQQCVDVMLTMNTAYRGANFGTMLLAKTRKGNVGKVFRYKTEFASCLIEEINEATYNAMVASARGGHH